MPSTRPRHMITESEAVADALAVAARRWPGERPAALLRNLALAGAEQLSDEQDSVAARRRGAVARHAGALAGSYPPEYLERLRGEWPE